MCDRLFSQFCTELKKGPTNRDALMPAARQRLVTVICIYTVHTHYVYDYQLVFEASTLELHGVVVEYL